MDSLMTALLYSLPSTSEASPTPGFTSAAKLLDAAAIFPNSLIGEGPFASEEDGVSTDADREADAFCRPKEGAGGRKAC